ncbi:hypothetical protein [Ensifer aridi]|uniref:hypothetical protein n=1 Tax=Ensifer aridi TaxID=1708715 RepID=UPI000A105342|nr:hypothetical protein [Ensifer aridi]
MTKTNNNPLGLRKGDRVRIKDTAEHRDYAARFGLPVDEDLVIHNISPVGIASFVGYAHTAMCVRLVLASKKSRIKAVSVPTEDVMAVLTKFVKEELGIDAQVETVIEAYGDALQLVFAEAA